MYYNIVIYLKEKDKKKIALGENTSNVSFSLPIMFYKYVLQKKRILSILGKPTRNLQRLLSLLDHDDSQDSEEIYLNCGGFFFFFES